MNPAWIASLAVALALSTRFSSLHAAQAGTRKGMGDGFTPGSDRHSWSDRAQDGDCGGA